MTGRGGRRDNATLLPGAAGAVPPNPPVTQTNSQDKNECSKYPEEDVQVHDSTFSGDMKKLADVLQKCNLGPTVTIPKFPGKTQELVTAWPQN